MSSFSLKSVLLAMLALSIVERGHCQQASNSGDATYHLDFLGKNFPDDWSRVASDLTDKNVLPIGEVPLQPGEGSCDAVLRALKFREHGVLCATSMQTLIDKLNPGLPKSLPVGTVIKYPNLPVGDISWTAAFDSNVPGDADRLKMVTTGGWSQLKTGERRNGALTQVEMKGYRATVAVPDSPASTTAVESVERYNPVINRSDIRASKLSAESIARSPFSNAQQKWYQDCLTPTGASPPKPAFMNFLADGDSKNDKCVANCLAGDRCPEIVLVDKAVAPHPDIASALGLPIPASPIPLCSNVGWKTIYHATHLSGIMVGADNRNSFAGLAPNSKLTSFDYDKSVGTPGLGSSELVKLIRQKSQFTNSRTIIFVFASKFNNIQDTDPQLSDPRFRRERPPFIPEILNSDNLWVVAAGQGNTNGKNIDSNTPDSPMNLGDTSNVLVVTSCEDCLTDNINVSNWANYSRNLVNVAAPGGTATDGIPGPATATDYSETFGTSQAAAMVGGLAAAMASCYPDVYKSGKMLKIRLQATSKPIVNPAIAEKVATGIINAKNALLDPRFHWITVAGQPMRKAKELQWCRSNLVLKQPDSEDPVHDGVFPSNRIRQIYRHIQTGAADEWYFSREPLIQSAAEIIPTGPGVMYDNNPLLRVRYDDGTLSDALTLDQVDGLVVGLGDAKVVVKACTP